jgi:ABC-type microcin C transport system permease subunit YejE
VNYVTLHSRILKIIINLWTVFGAVVGMYATFVCLEFSTFIKVYTSIPLHFFFLYNIFLIMIMITTVALAYAYGYKKGLRIGKDVTQG